MLTDDRTAVDAYDFAIGEGEGNRTQGLLVKVGLVIGGTEHGIIDDKIVGIGGWQSVVSIVDRTGQRQAQQTIRPTFDSA